MMIVTWSESLLEGHLRRKWATDPAVGCCSWFSPKPRSWVAVSKGCEYVSKEPHIAVGADTCRWVLNGQIRP